MKWFVICLAIFTLLGSYLVSSLPEISPGRKSIPSSPVRVLPRASVCPGAKGRCPTDHTCCPVPGNDQFHCCPSGYSCEKGLCEKIMAKIPAAVLTESAPASVVKCDQENACADKYSCCKTSQGYNCCPRGFMCSADGNTCTSGALNILAITAAPLKTLKQGMSLQKLITGKESAYPGSVILEGFWCHTVTGKFYCSYPAMGSECCVPTSRCCPSGYRCGVAPNFCVPL